MQTSKQMSGVIENSDRAAVLLGKIKADLGEAASLVEEIKRGRIFHFEPIYKQGELFPCLPNLPEENEVLARLCLDSLAETL
jgi:hypothetical protein